MKRSSLTIFFLCFLCISTYAQQEKLSLTASQLFEGFVSKLTPSEKNTIAQLSTFTLNTEDKRLYNSTDKKEGNTVFNVRVYVFDLTNDGVEEIGIIYNKAGSSSKEDISSMLFVKDKTGHYKLNLNESGEFYFLNLNELAFPDIYLRNTAIGLPTYRWNGNNYIKHTFLNPKKLKKYAVSSMTQASKNYNNTLIGE